MRVDQHMLVLFALTKNLFEHSAAKRIESRDRQVQDPPGGDVGGFLVHHFADVKDFEIMPRLLRSLHDGFEIWTLINPNLSGDDCAHVVCSPLVVAERMISDGKLD